MTAFLTVFVGFLCWTGGILFFITLNEFRENGWSERLAIRGGFTFLLALVCLFLLFQIVYGG